MRAHSLLLRFEISLLALALVAGFAQAQTLGSDPLESVQRQANAMAAALLQQNFAAVAATTCAPVLAQVGGAQALALKIETSFNAMHEQGRALLDMHFEKPDSIVSGDETEFANVPYRSVVHVIGGRTTVESTFVAVRNKGVEDWCFIDAESLTPKRLHELYPGAPYFLRRAPPSRATFSAQPPDKSQ